MRIYLAGPDVFYPDAKVRGRQMQAVCTELGLTGLYPLDAEIDTTQPQASLAIFTANCRLIDSADAVVANLRDFRGFEPDSGTVWEVSYARANGRPVVGYRPDATSLRERMEPVLRHGTDQDGMLVEDFGQPLNLMLMHSLSDLVVGPEAGFGGLKAALLAVRTRLNAGSPCRAQVMPPC